jgi:uncharacterized membrane protein YjgN (DUF898 family)
MFMEALRFEGSAGEYFKIWIVNILLTIVTLGLYYPWAKVRDRRYFYTNSSLEGRSFEYHATGKQLFKGYLIAMALLILYVTILQISPMGSIVVIFVFFLATPWIVWRSLKFNLRMTSFSNVRFSFEGLLGGAYVNYLLIPIAFFLALYGMPIGLVVIISLLGGSLETFHVILIMITGIACLGLAFYLFAFMKKRNASYAVSGYRYGQGQFSINVETKTFALILLKTIGISIGLMLALLMVVSLFAMVTVGMTQLMEIIGRMSDPEVMKDMMGAGLFMVIGPLYFLMIVVSLLTIAYTYARQRTYIFSNSTLDEGNTFASTLKARSLAWVMISNFLAVIFSLGFATPWAKVRTARLLLEKTEVNVDAGFEQYITAKQDEQSSLGEQIGDAFDIDIDLAI